jgi:hypothetical protein
MVGTPGSTAPAPPREPTVNVFYVDGGRSWIYNFGTSQGVRHRCFLAFMVGAPGSTAPAPPREPIVNFFTLMVGVVGSTALAPPREPVIDVS